MEMYSFKDFFCHTPLQRLKHLHFYLWLIAYGYGPRDVPGESSTSGPSAQLLEEFTWMEVVEKAPTLSSGPGWISMVELVEGMPLILALFLMPIYIGVSCHSNIVPLNWRASEASETLSEVYKFELVRYIYKY